MSPCGHQCPYLVCMPWIMGVSHLAACSTFYGSHCFWLAFMLASEYCTVGTVLEFSPLCRKLIYLLLFPPITYRPVSCWWDKTPVLNHITHLVIILDYNITNCLFSGDSLCFTDLKSSFFFVSLTMHLVLFSYSLSISLCVYRRMENFLYEFSLS